MFRLRYIGSLLLFAVLTGCSTLPNGGHPLGSNSNSAPSFHPTQTTPPAPAKQRTSTPADSHAQSKPHVQAKPHTIALPKPSYPVLTLGTQSQAVVRLQQLLAQQHYLPLTFTASNVQSATGGATLATTSTTTTNVATQLPAVQPQAGSWKWNYANTPTPLKQLWRQNSYTVLTEGAVMTFERTHGLAVDGVAGPQVWQQLLQAAAKHQHSPYGYGYVLVTKAQPEHLMVWYNGRTVLQSLANTGISQSPTPNGTWPVYLRFTSQTMSGVNPNGSHYSDPGVPWVNYFYQGDAVHGFVRSSYGFPQSLGCVELPIATAKSAWNYIHYGTLVTIAP